MKERNFTAGLFWGTLLGAVAGVLLAPEKGEKMRGILRVKWEKCRSYWRRWSREIEEKAKPISEALPLKHRFFKGTRRPTV